MVGAVLSDRLAVDSDSALSALAAERFLDVGRQTMAGSSPIRGAHVGAGPAGTPERGQAAAREHVRYYCGNGHVVDAWFAATAEIPDTWECRCGQPAGRDEQDPPPPHRDEPYKTHLAYLQERRSDHEAAAILDEALDRLRAARQR